MKRIFDFLLASLLLVLLSPFFFLITIVVFVTSRGPVIYWSERVGRLNAVFLMPKFRSMRVDTPVIATHLLNNPNQYLTPVGGFLRRSSLDELPQIWSILKGEMSFVGPRPALFNQKDLIELRSQARIQFLLPGVTGWAQVNGRDDLSLMDKVRFDKEYFDKQSLSFDLYILWLTFLKVVSRDGISH